MPKPKKLPNASRRSANAFGRQFAQSLKRTDVGIVPEVYRFLFDAKARYLVCHGSRGAGRSWSFARALILKAYEKPCRILCAREFQSSIAESVHRLLVDQISLLGLDAFFEVQANTIIGANQSSFIFEGLRHNVSKIKSLEGLTHVWVEEAEAVTEHSWSTLIPTVRRANSQILVTFNPFLESDPTYQRFVVKPPPNSIVKRTTWRDNPFFPQELEAERLYLQSVDLDSYEWIWEGRCRTISDALILKNKFTVEPFEVQPQWSGPHFGLDFGFSRDPSAAVKCYIDDVEKVLYIKSEMWGVGIDIDRLPAALEDAIPGASQHQIFCDSSAPAQISYLQRYGVSRAVGVEKWSGSVHDGVMYLRSFQRIVIDPACKQFLAEARSYSFVVDRLTGVPLPEVEDRNNHLMDATRYALSPLIRNLPTSGFFSRSALLERGQPVDLPIDCRPDQVLGVLATTDRPATAAGFIIFASFPTRLLPLVVADYDLVELDVALTAAWLETAFSRMREIATATNARTRVSMHCESNDIGKSILALAAQDAVTRGFEGPLMHSFLINDVKLPPTLDARALAVRATVSGGHVKFGRTAFDKQVVHRNTTACHLASQILGYRNDSPRDTPLELAAAFCLGVLITTTPGI